MNKDTQATVAFLQSLALPPVSEPMTFEEQLVNAVLEAGIAKGRADIKREQAQANAMKSNSFQYGAMKECALRQLDESYHWSPYGTKPAGLKLIETGERHSLEQVYDWLITEHKVTRDTAKNWVNSWRGKLGKR